MQIKKLRRQRRINHAIDSQEDKIKKLIMRAEQIKK